jgi:hypothetical protein
MVNGRISRWEIRCRAVSELSGLNWNDPGRKGLLKSRNKHRSKRNLRYFLMRRL